MMAKKKRMIARLLRGHTLLTAVVREPGIWKGERCWRDGCAGIIEERETDEGCTCFINPPCSHCVDDRHYCPECDWQGIDEQKA